MPVAALGQKQASPSSAAHLGYACIVERAALKRLPVSIRKHARLMGVRLEIGWMFV